MRQRAKKAAFSYLEGNELECDCKLAALVVALQKSDVAIDTARCHDRASSRERPLAALPTANLVCSPDAMIVVPTTLELSVNGANNSLAYRIDEPEDCSLVACDSASSVSSGGGGDDGGRHVERQRRVLQADCKSEAAACRCRRGFGDDERCAMLASARLNETGYLAFRPSPTSADYTRNITLRLRTKAKWAAFCRWRL